MAMTERQVSRRQALLGIAVGLVCWALVAMALVGGLFETFDERLLDWRYRLRGERDASHQVAIVCVDDATIGAYGGWPLPRDQYALLLSALEEAGARAVGVDLQFPEDVNHDPQSNALLAYVSSRPQVVHAISFLPADPTAPAGAPLAPKILASLRRQGEPGTVPNAPVAGRVAVPFNELMEQGRALGHITVVLDRDGAVRRAPLLVSYENRIYPSLGLRMVGVGSGHEGPPRVAPVRGGARVGWDAGLEWTLPIDRDGATSINFAGDRKAFSDRYSMIETLRAYRAGELARLRERFQGRYVLVGLDSRTEVTDDVGTTPFSAATSLVFIHANVVENLLRHEFLARLGPAVYLPLLALLAVALGWLGSAVPLPFAAILSGGTLLGVALIDYVLFALWNIDAPPLAALLLAPITYAGVASTRFLFLEAHARRREEEIREGRSVEQQFLPEALIGKNLSRYRIEEKLGRGGMGVVYRARDERLDRDVAIKILSGGALSGDRARRRFRHEALALSRLNHPHIAGVLDFDSQDGVDFIVMEFVRGTQLSARLARGHLPEADALRILCAVTEALAEAHGRGVVHRDLKPDNVMIGERGEVKVLDFGLALLQSASTTSVLSRRLTEEGHMVGTLPYMAPEVLRGMTAEPRSDLYSLGVLAFEMTTGRRPFPDDEPHELLYTVLNQAPPPPRILNGRISRDLEEIILRLLTKSPVQRFESASALRQALGALHPAPEPQVPASSRT